MPAERDHVPSHVPSETVLADENGILPVVLHLACPEAEFHRGHELLVGEFDTVGRHSGTLEPGLVKTAGQMATVNLSTLGENEDNRTVMMSPFRMEFRFSSFWTKARLGTSPTSEESRERRDERQKWETTILGGHRREDETGGRLSLLLQD